MQKNNLLRYKITAWPQAVNCLSNNSKYLRIQVSQFLDTQLHGTKISVEDEKFGTLFACIVDGSGEMLTKESPKRCHELTTDEILAELAKFGFIIQYEPVMNLAADQLIYLMTLNDLKFDKIRMLNVKDKSGTTNTHLVAFMSDRCTNWLSTLYVPASSEYEEALCNGSATCLDIVGQSAPFKWDWLNYVATISDLILQNSQRR